MIIGKGKSRGNGGQLGNYLLRDPKNAEAELIDSRGFGAGDLSKVLHAAEIEAQAKTRGEKVFYFAAITPEDGESITREQWREIVEIAERHLGYGGLDRAVARHRKEDRRPNEPDHYHVVWNRFDRETGKLRSDSFNGQKLRAAMDEIEERFSLRLRAEHPSKDKTRTTDDEARQDERSTKTKAERVAEITGLWNQTDSGKAFRAALDAAGYTLATGNRRGFCVVDEASEVHSLARQIGGAKTADIKARLAELDPATIPDAETVKIAIKQAKADRGDPAEATVSRPTAADRQAEDQRDAAQIRDAEALYTDEPGLHVPTPRERSEAERADSIGIAEAVLKRLTDNRSTFTRADLEREAAKLTGYQGRESWMAQTGGLDELDEKHRASAERSYEKWSEENPHAAAKYGLDDYVSYTQKMEAARQGERDPAALKERAERAEAFRYAMAAIDQGGEIVSVGPDPRNPTRDRYTTRDMLRVELEMEAAGATLGDRGGHAARAKTRDTARKQTETAQGFELSGEQRGALKHITGESDISIVVGYAGAGKSTMLNAARAAYEAQGFRVQGAALSGIAARGLADSAGIKSHTLDRVLHRLDGHEAREAAGVHKISQLEAKAATITGKSQRAQKYRNDLAQQAGAIRADLDEGKLSSRDVIFVDEAGMIGSRKMGRLLKHAMEAGAKVVLIGDHEQVQAIEAGAAFRALMDRHGAAVMKDVRRQVEEWQREATKGFPDGRAREALNAYRDHGMTHETGTRDEAKAATVEAWAQARAARPDDSSIMLTHLNADVHSLNQLGRAAYRAEGRLGPDHELKVKDASIALAEGDRLLFRKNDGHLDVKNGSLGTVQKIEGEAITVALDTAKGEAGKGKHVTFKLADYQEFSHGYAATVHKTQGATVDRAFVLATPGMDKHTAYVAMSRHRERADLFYAKEDFRDHDAMTSRLARSGAKDSVLDYMQRAENGDGFASTLRAAVAGLWGKIASIFHRGDHHPAETAQQGREEQPQRPGERLRTFAARDGQEATRAASQPTSGQADPVQRETAETEAARNLAAEEARRAARAAAIAKLREEAAKRERDDRAGPGGRG